MNAIINSYLASVEKRVFSPTPDRASVLHALSDFILDRQQRNDTVRLNFICTHNARRSHISQLLCAAIAIHADLENIECYSGGVETTRIHVNSMRALEQVGFEFAGQEEGENPHFLVDLGEANLIEVFSKRFDEGPNPTTDFAAVMVCSSADEACPFVPGASARIALTFDDPKEFDQDDDPIAGYMTRVDEIASELMYVMQRVSSNLPA